MKSSEIKLIQRALARADLYNGEIDGQRGAQTDGAIVAALAANSARLPPAWQEWSGRRKAVAYLQLLCSDSGLDAGKIDGFYGPQTETAAGQLGHLEATGSVPRGFVDIVPIDENPHDFPVERAEALTGHYQKPGEGPLVKVPCPWTLRLDWDLSSTTTSITIHEKLVPSLTSILQNVYALYGPEGIRKHGLDRYGGSFNCRKKRGSQSEWSTHAWGIAIDWYPSRNKLHWHAEKASLAHPDLDAWWEIWEKEGWLSLGRREDRDWMHVQAAKR